MFGLIKSSRPNDIYYLGNWDIESWCSPRMYFGNNHLGNYRWEIFIGIPIIKLYVFLQFELVFSCETKIDILSASIGKIIF